jgi:Dihydroorotase and related cyclic amidohydrolases
MGILIKNGIMVNRGLSFKGSLLISGEIIEKIVRECDFEDEKEYLKEVDRIYREEEIDAEGLYVIPGVIDDQVHFREPGNVYKGDIESESKAAVLGGVTSFMDMPNNSPAATTNIAIREKFKIAAEKSYANYSFYLGATNDNLREIEQVDNNICGIKVFMGSSTGNMLVNDTKALNEIFAKSPILIATHCEQEEIINRNLAIYKEKFGEDIPFEMHPYIRSREACIESTKRAIDLAIRNNSRLHVLHISTKDEVDLIKNAQLKSNKISGEVCVHYMWFNSNDYAKFGSKIKCNPAIKLESDMLAIRNAVNEGVIRVVATDHAPHLKSEKENNYIKAPSGLPLVQHSLQIMLELHNKGIFSIEKIVSSMCHSPAECFNINKRGFLDEGYFADITLINLNLPDKKSTSSPAYKCNWSPFEGYTFKSSVIHTIVNGVQVVKNGKITNLKNSKELVFNR